MKGYNVTDLAAAAKHLESAKSSILEAVRALCNHRKAQDLKDVAEHLGMKAKIFGEGKLLPGLSLPVVGPKGAARAMGKIESPLKLEKLAAARAELAKVRHDARVDKERRQKVAKHTMALDGVARLARAAVKRAAATAAAVPAPPTEVSAPALVAVSATAAPVKPTPIVIQEV